MTCSEQSSKVKTNVTRKTLNAKRRTRKEKPGAKKYEKLEVGAQVTMQPEKHSRDNFVGTVQKLTRCKDGYPQTMEVKIKSTPNRFYGVKDKILVFHYQTIKGKNRAWVLKTAQASSSKHIPQRKHWDLAA